MKLNASSWQVRKRHQCKPNFNKSKRSEITHPLQQDIMWQLSMVNSSYSTPFCHIEVNSCLMLSGLLWLKS
jgi:hypothetical protein